MSVALKAHKDEPGKQADPVGDVDQSFLNEAPLQWSKDSTSRPIATPASVFFQPVILDRIGFV